MSGIWQTKAYSTADVNLLSFIFYIQHAVHCPLLPIGLC